MDLVSGTESAVEPISLAEAKSHLRQAGPENDAEIKRLITSAREFCERYATRTFRSSVQRTANFTAWPSDNQSRVYLPWPPLASVNSVKYYDQNDTDTTLSTANYHVIAPPVAKGYIQWDDTFTYPALSDRPNAVRILYTSGESSIPAIARQAILLRLSVEFGDAPDMTSRMLLESAELRSRQLLDMLDTQAYR